MNQETFWKLIDAAYVSDDEYTLKLLESRYFQALDDLSAEELTEFARVQTELMAQAYGHPLWNAATVINGFCSDDSFSHFRVGLIALGKEKFYRCLENPDSIAEILRQRVVDLIDCGQLDFAPELIYVQKFGRDQCEEIGPGSVHGPLTSEPYGIPLDPSVPKERELLQQQLPKLLAQFDQPAE